MNLSLTDTCCTWFILISLTDLTACRICRLVTESSPRFHASVATSNTSTSIPFQAGAAWVQTTSNTTNNERQRKTTKDNQESVESCKINKIIHLEFLDQISENDQISQKTATPGAPWAELDLVHSCFLDSGGSSSFLSTPQAREEQRGVVRRAVRNSSPSSSKHNATRNCAKQTGFQNCGKNSDCRETFTLPNAAVVL